MLKRGRRSVFQSYFNQLFKHLKAQAKPGFLIGGGGDQTTNRMHWHYQKFSRKKVFVGQRYRRMEDQKLWPDLTLN